MVLGFRLREGVDVEEEVGIYGSDRGRERDHDCGDRRRREGLFEYGVTAMTWTFREGVYRCTE